MPCTRTLADCSPVHYTRPWIVANYPLGKAIAAATRSLLFSSCAALAGSYAENAELEVATSGSGCGKAGTLRLRNYKRAQCARLKNACRDAAK